MDSSEGSYRFEWDEEKAAANLVKHGLPFEAAVEVFADLLRLEEDDQFAKGEYRTLAVGRVDGLLITVVFAEPDEGLIRIISARRTTPAESKAYEKNLLRS